jgi:putative addiction module component (TIGR02574 family)
MPETKKIIDEALSLPVEERARLVNTLLESLNVPNPAIDKKWAQVAKRRLEELRSGKVKPISGDEVFDRVHKRFSK